MKMNPMFKLKMVIVSIVFMAGAVWLGASGYSATTEGRTDLLPLGSAAPKFELPDVVKKQLVSLDQFADKKALVVLFICRHCPYVQHVNKALAALGHDYAGKSVGIVAISANDPAAFPEDAPESLAEMGEEEGFNFPLF